MVSKKLKRAGDLSDQEREMILSWQEVIEGIFQIDRKLPDGFTLKQD
ncbi:MAG: hypothetical protein ACE5JP_01585 [Candidatus Bipolaricaulia bacterium]